MIINKHKIIHIHIPKCGGSSVHEMLKSYKVEGHIKKNRHATYVEYENEIGREINNYKIFAIVRNPWAWHVSWYFYLRNTSPIYHGHNIEYSVFNKKEFKFNNYVYWLIDETQLKSKQNYLMKNQYDWCINENGEFMVNHILKLENINEDYRNFCEIYNINENNFIIKNKGKHAHHEKYYTNETRKIIRDLHQRDVEKFKYIF